MKKAQYKIIHVKPNTQLQLKLGTNNYKELLHFWFQIFGPYVILIYSGYLQRKTHKAFNKACVCGRVHCGEDTGDRSATQGSSVLGRQALYR